ncbi:hypothetical protein B566_EDAN012478 [Ephemera danica]|nr:hypothetical protein B566_EDAN012478 [Ephemera danica]
MLIESPQRIRLGYLENITQGTAGPCEDLLDTEHLTAVYNNYEFDCIPQNLPIVAYKSKIGLKDCTSEDTRLLYCTTGVLLQTLIGERSLQRYTHIILDEVHERNKDMDFLLLIVRKLQRTISRNVKVVLMSATLNSVRFGQYFSMNIAGNLCNAPILALESSKKHNLSIYYLGELTELGVEIKQRKEDAPEPIVTHNHHQLVLTLIKTFDKLEVEGQLRVIDYCMMKELVADPYTNFTSLCLVWASKANCTQRAGRTGRIGPGRVYRLLHKSEFEQLLDEQIPEMKRSPLDHLVLKSKQLSSDKPKALLALALDPPELKNIESTILQLKEAGGLLMTAKGEYCSDDGDITYLGTIMAELPLDIHVSKMVALGHIFGVLEDCIIMGASMSVKNMFARPYKKDLEAYMSKLAWSSCSSSDPIAFLKAYTTWKKKHEGGDFRQEGSEAKWVRRYFLESRCLREIKDLVEDLQKRLMRLGISDKRQPNDVIWSEDEEPLVLKLVLAGAFYPNYFVRGSLGGQVNEEDAVKLLVGRDPYSSVKVYVEFPKVEVPKATDGNPVARAPGQVSLMVYKAIKLGKISKFELRVLPEWKVKNHTERLRKPPLLALAELGSERSRQIYQQHDLRERWRSDVRPGIACVSPAPSSVASSSSTHIHTKLPGLNITHLRLKSPFLETPGRFWVNIVEDESGMQQMHNCLNANPAELVPLEPRQLYVGQMVVAPYLDTQWLIARQRNLGAHTQPDFALECRLAMVQASQIKGCGQWSADAIKVFRDHVLETIFYARVYSVVNSVVSLIDNHKTRDNVAKNLLTEDQIAVYEELQCSTLGLEVTSDPQPPPPCDTTNTVKLTGPYSPLEMKVYQMVKGGSNTKEVSIDPNSVNSVLIDDEPQDKFDRLIVAASVHNSQDGNRLTLRQTTIMPNLPGLPALVCLLFAPRVELRVDRDKEKITGGLFGLGCKPSDPRHRPLFPAHDMELPFDTVNKLRFWMNSAWLKLLARERNYKDPVLSARSHKWGLLSSELRFPMCKEEAEQQVFPMHWGVKLLPPGTSVKKRLEENLKELKSMCCRAEENVDDKRCDLCKEMVQSLHQLKSHLQSSDHLLAEAQLYGEDFLIPELTDDD